MEKTIIVTGASRGIGLAVAKSLLDASHNVVLISRSAEPLQELKERYPSQVACLAADMTAEDVSDAGDLVSSSITTQNVCVLTFSRQH
jgi:short-subunit dehydrogenase